MARRFAFPFVVILLLSACDAVQPDASAAGSRDAAASVVRLAASSQGRVDAYFRHDALRPGEAVSARSGDADLVSRALGSGWHAVSVRSASRHILSVTGTRHGVVQWTSAEEPGSISAEAGETSGGPTSVHYRRSCTGDFCVDIVEYDYDRTASTGDGAVTWHADGRDRGAVDRIRVELPASADGPDGVRLQAPRRLAVLR